MRKRFAFLTVLMAFFVFAGSRAFCEKLVNFKNVQVKLATAEEGRALITQDDTFMQHITDMDKMVILGEAGKGASLETYKKAVGDQALDFDARESKLVTDSILNIRGKLSKLNILFPSTIYIVKTTGKEEGDSAYCRSLNVICYSTRMLANKQIDFDVIMTHELFHILSRNNLAMQEKLYNAVGYYRAGNIALPPEIAGRLLTNPDSVLCEFYFKALINGSYKNVVPLIVIAPEFTGAQGQRVFSYFNLTFFEIDMANGVASLKKDDKGAYIGHSMDEITNYFDIIGANTHYIIHPDEILAENFECVVFDIYNIPSPDIPNKMRAIFKKGR